MKIIGHRGAAGLALENSRASLLAAIDQGVDIIEFDVRLTADDHLVVIHDKKTGRVSEEKLIVRQQTLEAIRESSLGNGESIMSLDEALDTIGSMPVIIELKDENSVDELLLVLERHPDANPYIASFLQHELRKVRRALPDIPVFVLDHYAPIDIIHTAHNMRAAGIGLNKWLMNPLTYHMAKHYHLQMYVYTVNNMWLALFLHTLYPDVHLCSDRPEKLLDKFPASSRHKS
jgi:glycerophosphoryl diester phosphodiesterase